ncbi:phenylacetate--CoA ligase family protein [Devosia beringensis]|uniref:hypothetical protein n=1 Tax=Devosia beringensis TaxID=2657486 RepID=UPI001AEDEEBD|nr:hypothetical protein [Devosia beringensis]
MHLPDRFRVGRGYAAAVRQVRRFETYEQERARSETFVRLQGMVAFAYNNVPFYRQFYGDQGFHPTQLASLEDWDAVPVVRKEDFQTVPVEQRCVPGAGSVLSNTGGTSGRPLVFQLPKDAPSVEWAHMHELWKARGYRTSAMKLRIGGTHYDRAEPFRYHPRHNELIVNANCPLSEVVAALLALIERYCVRWVHGYPSLVAEFAHSLAASSDGEAARFRSRLHGVLLGSEFPARVYREPIGQILSTNILSWYGHSEMALLAGETAAGIYQSMPTYGYAEAVPVGSGPSHRLVSTSLHNRVHPFIRYDTGDLVEPVARVGASLAFRIAQGRIGDFVVDRSGARHALTAIIFGRHHGSFDDVQHLQVRQTVPGHMTLLVVPTPGKQDQAALAAGFDFSGLDLDWSLELVNAPIRSSGGKIKLKIDG